MAAFGDLRRMQDPIVAVAEGNGETQCLKIHSGEALDGSSLRSQATMGPAVYPSLEPTGAHPPPSPLIILPGDLEWYL